MTTAPPERTPLEGLDFHAAHAENADLEAVDASLVRRRHDVFGQVDEWGEAVGDVDQDLAPSDAVQVIEGIATVDAANLSTAAIATGLNTSGCLIIRGLLDTDTCGELKAGIDRSLHDRDNQERGRWYAPFGEDLNFGELESERAFSQNSGSMFAVDSPRMFRSMLGAYRRCGLAGTVERWFGGRAAVSARKCALWRVRPDLPFADWHQDGAFMGRSIRTINSWVALSTCGAGTSSPGMDLVPIPKMDFAPTGINGAAFEWSVSHTDAMEAAGEVGIVHPTFSPGDGVLFTERLLHRTATREGLSDPRYALETWWFPAADFPESQIPLVF